MDLTRREAIGLLGGGALATFVGCSSGKSIAPAATTWKKSVCRFCGTGCGVQLGFLDGRLVDVRGDELAHNRGLLCVKGSLLTELPKLPGRLSHPLIREKSRLRKSTWKEAMDRIASEFSGAVEKAGPSSVGFYGSGQLYTEETYTANKLFKAGLRSNNVEGNPRLCMASAAFGYVTTFGKDEPMGCYEDLDHATCYFVIGANPAECHPVLFERMRLRLGKAKLIVVDPLRTKTARRADRFLQVVPGTDLLLLNAMAHVIVEDGLVDRPFVEEHCEFEGGGNLVSYRKFLQTYAPEKVAERIGVAATRIREIAHLFATSKATMSLWTMGINQRTQGVFLNNTLNSLHLLTGQICRPGATPLSLTGQGNACGGVRDTGALSHLLPGGRLIEKAKHREEMEKLWKVPAGTIDPKPGWDATELFRAAGDGRLRALLIMGTNPMQTLPDLTHQKKKDCFVALAEPFENTRTSEIADVILPAALWVEKEGVYGQTERRYQLLEKVLDPPGEARSDLEILVDLANRLGHGKLIQARTPGEVWDEWRKISAASLYNFEGITRERLRMRRGLQWPCPDGNHPGTKRRFVGGDDPFVPKGKKVSFYGRPSGKALIHMRPYQPAPEAPTKEYPMILTTGRVLEQWHSGTITDRIVELHDTSGRGQVRVNPADARRLGIRKGDTVRLQSRFGSMTIRAVIDPAPRIGVAWASFFDAKVLINRVVADHVDPMSRQPEYKVTAVRLSKVT